MPRHVSKKNRAGLERYSYCVFIWVYCSLCMTQEQVWLQRALCIHCQVYFFIPEHRLGKNISFAQLGQKSNQRRKMAGTSAFSQLDVKPAENTQVSA